MNPPFWVLLFFFFFHSQQPGTCLLTGARWHLSAIVPTQTPSAQSSHSIQGPRWPFTDADVTMLLLLHSLLAMYIHVLTAQACLVYWPCSVIARAFLSLPEGPKPACARIFACIAASVNATPHLDLPLPCAISAQPSACPGFQDEDRPPPTFTT